VPIVGFGVAFIGYSLFYYGITQVRGHNYGLLDLVLPGRWANASSIPDDGGSAPSSPGAGPTAPSVTPNPGGKPEGTYTQPFVGPVTQVPGGTRIV
jgi:hypothetical protein